jgi:hypothetical protein
MVETRRAPRHRVLKAAKICWGAGAIDCTVRNLSSSGAALVVSNQIGIPEKFTLAVPGDGLRLPCMSCGVKDTGSASHSTRAASFIYARVRVPHGPRETCTPIYSTNSKSPGFQVLSNHGSIGA